MVGYGMMTRPAVVVLTTDCENNDDSGRGVQVLKTGAARSGGVRWYLAPRWNTAKPYRGVEERDSSDGTERSGSGAKWL